MKIGKFYEDINTGELFMADNFTSTKYCWIKSDGTGFEEEKTEAYKHISGTACNDKKKIKDFLDKLDYKVRGLCETCNRTYVSKFVKYEKEIAQGQEFCPVCGSKLRY